MEQVSLYAGVGSKLIHFIVDVSGAALQQRETIEITQNVQYAWPHASRRYLYVASSSMIRRGPVGTSHFLSALKIDSTTGSLSHHGDPIQLPSRPIHVTTDRMSKHALVAFDTPSRLLTYKILSDGTLGPEVEQETPAGGGFIAHQVRVFPDNRLAVLVTRGNDAKSQTPEDPGALMIFRYSDGKLSFLNSVAPNGGYGFGPRHLDFHPTQPWIYLSDERYNKLFMFKFGTDGIESKPAFVTNTLSKPPFPHQLSGTVHVHPNGKYVYSVNRAYTPVEVNGRKVLPGGENNVVAYAINDLTGEPVPIQHINTEGVYGRTFHIDPTARLLAVGNMLPMEVQDGQRIRSVPASLALFRILENGTLDYMRKYDIDVGSSTMFWTGIV